jgi:hypothetical protein
MAPTVVRPGLGVVKKIRDGGEMKVIAKRLAMKR